MGYTVEHCVARTRRTQSWQIRDGRYNFQLTLDGRSHYRLMMKHNGYDQRFNSSFLSFTPLKPPLINRFRPSRPPGVYPLDGPPADCPAGRSSGARYPVVPLVARTETAAEVEDGGVKLAVCALSMGARGV